MSKEALVKSNLILPCLSVSNSFDEIGIQQTAVFNCITVCFDMNHCHQVNRHVLLPSFWPLGNAPSHFSCCSFNGQLIDFHFLFAVGLLQVKIAFYKVPLRVSPLGQGGESKSAERYVLPEHFPSMVGVCVRCFKSDFCDWFQME